MRPAVFAWRPNLREQHRMRARSSGAWPRNTSIQPGGVVTHPSLHGVPSLSSISKAGQRTLSLHIYGAVDVDRGGRRRYGPAAAREMAYVRLSGTCWGVAKW